MIRPRRRRRALTPALATLTILLTAGLAQLVPTDREHEVQLAHASGLRPGDEVRVAGIAVGTVESVRLDGVKAVATVTTEPGVRFTEQTRAAVKLSSLLGGRYLELRPGHGPGLDGPLPLSRTEPAYTLDNVFVDGRRELDSLDLDAVGQAIDVLATDLAEPSKQAGATLAGVTALSRLVASRDEQLGRLLGTTREVTGIVRSQQRGLVTLAEDADLVMQLVYERRAVISRLLADTRRLVAEVSGLVDRNQRHLRPMLLQMKNLLGLLEKRRQELDETLELTGPMMRYYANAAGDGPWVNVYAPYFLLPDNILCPLLTPEECG